MSNPGYVDSYYSATLNDDRSYPPIDSDIEVETCIIGGGYAGLMTALGLVERGHRDIAILEQHRVGWGASGRNGGFVFGGYSLGPRALVKQVGVEKARQLYDFTIMGVNLIRQRIAKFNIDCDLVDAGVIWANWFKGQQRLFDEQAFMREKMGVEWEYLSPEVLRERVQSERYHGGLFEPNAMHFHPLNYARGIAREIVKEGGLIHENTRVIDIDASQATKRVITDRGVVRCKNLVLAGGGYIGNLCPPVARSILPISTYVMTTQPLGDELSKLLTTKTAIYDTRFAFDYYRPLADTRLLWGGRISANTRQPPDLKEILKRDMLKVFPQLEAVNIDYAWDGWMGYSRDQMVQIGELSPAVWYAVGFGGHGVAPTTAVGEILASAITGQSRDYQLFKPWGLPWNGGILGPGMAQLSYWWYQAQDWLREKLE